MSLFGTLGKKRPRKTSVSNQALGLSSLKDQSASTAGLFKSTPNLHSIDGDGSCDNIVTEDEFDTPSGLVYYDYNKIPSSPFRVYPNDETDLRHDTGAGCHSPSSSLSSISHSVGSADTPSNKTPFKSLRGFVSLVTTATGVKKSKSMGRKPLVSATHLKNPDHSMRDVKGVIHEDAQMSYSVTTPRRSLSTQTSSLSIKSSQSVPNMEQKSDQYQIRSSSSDDMGRYRHRINGEPGIDSSSTSLSSAGTNPSDTASSRSRCPSISAHSDTFEPDVVLPSDPEVQRRKVMLQGAKKFNMDPKKGIDLLVDQGFMERTPETVAQFLKHGEQLSKSAIGNYLGEHHEFNLEVLSCFVELHDFTNVLLVEALRQFLWSFRLPGEAQKIDRMMECFAKRYTHLNPSLFANSDTCYLLSFAIIMLNTSLHNPNVKEKPTLDQFIQMNRDIDNGQPLDRKFVTSLYNSILTEPFQIPPEDGNDLMLTFFNPAIEGWLWKQGGRYKSWKRRWFILSNNCLYYFIFTTDKDPRGIIPLENVRVRTSLEMGKDFCFMLYKDTNDPDVTDYIKSCKASDGRLTAGKHVRYHFATKTKEDRDRWVSAIAQNSSYHNFYTVLAQKKNRLEVQQRSGTLKRNRLHHQPTTPIGAKSPASMRKSQIGLPLTRLDFGLSFDQLHSNSDLLPPDVSRGKNPHEYFASASTFSSTSNLVEDGQREFESERSSPMSPHRHFDQAPASVLSYSTQSLPRTKSKKKVPRQLHVPLRKFSLPPDSLPGRLTSKVEYLTAPSIHISVEDTGQPVDNDPGVAEDDQVILSQEDQTAKFVRTATPEPSEVGQDSESVPADSEPPPIPAERATTQRCTTSLIIALKDFASAMEGLDLDCNSTNENDWAEIESLSAENLGHSGLTKQCLRSSFKSKRSRHRTKHRKFPSSESRRDSVAIEGDNLDQLIENPMSPSVEHQAEAEYKAFEFTVLSESQLRTSDTEHQSEA